jgi:hypothetical protein
MRSAFVVIKMSIKTKRLTGKLSETNDQKALSICTQIWLSLSHAAGYKQAVLTHVVAPTVPLTPSNCADLLLAS